MNFLTIAGNLGKDAEIRHLGNGDPVDSFSVADSPGKDKPTIWWNCSLFGKRAEALSPYLTKGQKVTVCGTVTEREWTDKQGQARKSMDVRVQEIALQGGKSDGESRTTRPAAQPTSQRRADFDDDSIPFANPYRGRRSFVV